MARKSYLRSSTFKWTVPLHIGLCEGTLHGLQTNGQFSHRDRSLHVASHVTSVSQRIRVGGRLFELPDNVNAMNLACRAWDVQQGREGSRLYLRCHCANKGACSRTVSCEGFGAHTSALCGELDTTTTSESAATFTHAPNTTNGHCPASRTRTSTSTSPGVGACATFYPGRNGPSEPCEGSTRSHFPSLASSSPCFLDGPDRDF